MRKEQELDRQRQPKVQRNNDNQQYFARLALCGAEHGVQVPHEESRAHSEADGHKGPVEYVKGRPADERHGHPDEVRVAIERPALEEVGCLGAEVTKNGEEGDRYEESVAVDEAGGA